MLKLMKHEFRKMSSVLLILLAVLASLEIGYVAGFSLHKDTLMGICLGLITMMAFGVYVYLLVSGIVSYARELHSRSGYLIFMTPVHPLGVVLSKLLFTALISLVITALFGVMAYLDFRMLLNRIDVDAQTMNQINMLLRFGLNAGADLSQILLVAGFWTLVVLIQIMMIICTAYLAITLGATLLQNRKPFLRVVISITLFVLLTWGCNTVVRRLLYDRVALDTQLSQLYGVIGWSLLLNFGFCAVFTAASTWLLDHKVNL